MEMWVENVRAEAQKALAMGYVREIIFSGSTYQVDVYDPLTQENYWPFLQFDERGRLKDAFCSCQTGTERCYHLAAAYLKIIQSNGQPLHLLFEKSLWFHLCQLCADHSGYEERFLQKMDQGHYRCTNEFCFEIQAKTEEATRHLEEIIEKRPRENPENSIKFSNLSQEEIQHWREGRPSSTLRFALSFWSDLAQWMMQHSKVGTAFFSDDAEGYPTEFHLDFPFLSIHIKVKKEDLPRLIPYLDSVKTSLKLFPSAEKKIIAMTFNPAEPAFYLEHESLEVRDFSQEKRWIGGWIYLPKIGFYPIEGQPLLHRQCIGKEEILEFLQNYSQQINLFIPIHDKKQSLSYSMYFDEQWNWHFSAYLFKEGDLLDPDSLLLKGWVFIKKRGFFPIENPFFDEVSAILSPNQVSHFVNHHRIWLGGQEGFQTHLASVESHIVYTVTENKRLRFQSRAEVLAQGVMDFGDWIFYQGQGFFSKKYARLGMVVRPGLEVRAQDLSAFIKANREELESIPHFFTQRLPLAFRGLEVSIPTQYSLHIKPAYQLLPEFQHLEIHLFGDFAYIKGEGFVELPLSMRLPERYLKEQTISHYHLHDFIENDLPLIKNHILSEPSTLQTPHKLDLSVHHLSRMKEGGLSAELVYQTEFGQVAVTDLLEALSHKKRYCFTSAGLIDLHHDLFQWLRYQKRLFHAESKTLELSTMEFLRLDATQGIYGPQHSDLTLSPTWSLLKELREFSAQEMPLIKGLKSELRTYQKTGLQWLWFLYQNELSGLLCDDMGLGKTHQAMAMIAASLNANPDIKKRFLVVCPTSVIYHWQDKLEIFLPHLKVHTFHGAKRTLKRVPKQGILLTSYGILRMEQKELEKFQFEISIYDEIQVAKNPRSRVHEALKQIKGRMRIGLTGTPIENNLKELKALFDIILPGYMPTDARFREFFIQPIERDQSEEKKTVLKQLIKPFVLRRRKSEVLKELPEKSEDKSYCDLSEEQRFLYQETLAQSRENVMADLRDTTLPVNYIHIFALLSRLKQVCDHPALVYKDPKNFKNYHSGKWELFVELLDEARESDQKVVIFSQYLYMLDVFEAYFKEKKWNYAQIRGDTINRREELKRFQEDPHCGIFIGSLQAAGLGIDLTAASVVILYDRWWNAARENQAIDRVHRIGQKWGVQVYKLITKNTIEEKIDLMITRKGRLLEEVVIAEDQALIKTFTRNELIDLLSFESSD